MSAPTSSVPVVSTVTCTKIGMFDCRPAARASLARVDRGLDVQRVLAGLDQDAHRRRRRSARGTAPSAPPPARRSRCGRGSAAWCPGRCRRARSAAGRRRSSPPPRAPARRDRLLISNACVGEVELAQRDGRAAEAVGHAPCRRRLRSSRGGSRAPGRGASRFSTSVQFSLPQKSRSTSRVERLDAAAHAAVAQQDAGRAARREDAGGP